MKKSILLSSLLATTVLFSVACTKSQSHKDELNKTLADIRQKNEESKNNLDESIEKATKMLKDGGQPGSITLNGAITRAADKSDNRLSVSQAAGLNSKGSETELTATDILKVDTLSGEKLEQLKASFKNSQETEKTFINLGCGLNETDTAGLTEVQAKIGPEDQIVNLSATRIFMCGSINYDRLSYTISASEIMIKHLDLKHTKNVGTLRLNAGTLVLVGPNKVETLGEDSSTVLLPGSSLEITVTDEIFGEGQLELSSKGGNNISEQQK